MNRWLELLDEFSELDRDKREVRMTAMTDYWLDFVEYMNNMDAITPVYLELIENMKMNGFIVLSGNEKFEVLENIERE